jgi:hypothetical protein
LRVLPSPRAVASIEAAYLIGTGVWPLLHRASFERLTGEKREFWLAANVDGSAAAAGLAMGVAVARGSKPPETTVLALATGLVFALADVRAACTESRRDAVLRSGVAHLEGRTRSREVALLLQEHESRSREGLI